MNKNGLSGTSKSLIFILCAGLFAGVFIKLFVFDILHVSGHSMEPAIQDKSTLAVNKLAFGLAIPWSDHLLIQWHKPKPDDVIIYLYNNKIVVKRCVAVSGQLLEISSLPLYTLKVGDKNIPLTEEQFLKLQGCTSVPEGYFLAIGDNYEQSVDSRNYGFVSERNVLGKVLCR